MRYYDLILSSNGKTIREWTSHPNGQFDPGALLIDFDVIVTPFSAPAGGQQVSVYGISLNDLFQAREFTGLTLTLFGGMKKGLPLANPTQSGLLMTGQVFQSWGNWEGTEMVLNFIVYPDIYSNDTPGNLVLNWPAGMPLAEALNSMLTVAYPSQPLSINIANITQTQDEMTAYSCLSVFSSWLLQKAPNFMHSVQIVNQGGKINVFDETYTPAPVQLEFFDFIGQPTWINPGIMQVKTALRADIMVSGQIKLPIGIQNAPGFIVTQGTSTPSSLKYKSTFTGNFIVTEMRHIGNYKAHEGAAWATLINCTPENLNG